MMTKVLLVSNDSHGTRRLMAASPPNLRYHLLVAGTRAEAMFHLRTDDVCVVAADENGDEDDPIALLEQVAREQPTVARIYMASDMNLSRAVRLINRASIFRLLTKPTHIDDFHFAIEAAMHAQTARSIDQQTGIKQTDAVGFGRLASAPPRPPELTVQALLEVDGQPLSRREREILLAVVEGKKPAEIARLFFISVHTARNHIKALYRKLSVHSQVELIAKVLKTDRLARPRQVG